MWASFLQIRILLKTQYYVRLTKYSVLAGKNYRKCLIEQVFHYNGLKIKYCWKGKLNQLTTDSDCVIDIYREKTHTTNRWFWKSKNHLLWLRLASLSANLYLLSQLALARLDLRDKINSALLKPFAQRFLYQVRRLIVTNNGKYIYSRKREAWNYLAMYSTFSFDSPEIYFCIFLGFRFCMY